MNHEERSQNDQYMFWQIISWKAIFAGTLTVLSVLLVLNLIGVGIGAGTIDPTEEADPLSGLGTGSLIWWIVSNLIALFAGGFVAARAGASIKRSSGIIQGIMTWALYTVISVWLVASMAGGIISGVGDVIGGAFTAVGQVGDRLTSVIEDQVEELDVSLDQAREEFNELLEEADDPEALKAEARDIFRAAVNVFDGSFGEVDQQALVDILAEHTDMDEAEAEETVNEYLADYEQMRSEAEAYLAQARETANEQAEIIAGAVARASIYLAIALILGVIAAAFGGITGVKNLREDYERTYTLPPETEVAE